MSFQGVQVDLWSLSQPKEHAWQAAKAGFEGGVVLEFSGIAGGLHQNSAARKSVGEQPELEHGPNAAYPCGA